MSWNIIPAPGASSAEVAAEVANIAWRATSLVDTYCNQVLRATVDTEQLSGPGAPRVGVQRDSGNGILVMRRWPVTEVLAVQISPNRSWPRVWTPVPAGMYEAETPLINAATDTASATAPDGGPGILVAPGYITWGHGRGGQRIQVSYTNGWPHTSLTADTAAGGTVLAVDDVTGWAGASGFAYDGAGTEPVAVTTAEATTPLVLPNGVGTAQTGPGTITLTSALTYDHPAGTVISALPATALWATVLAAATQALESGITAITIQTLPGSQTTGGHGVSDLEAQYKQMLDPFKRVV